MLKNKDGLSKRLKKICNFLDGLNKSMEINVSETGLTKRVKVLQHRTAGIRHSPETNRIVPIETVIKSEFESKHDVELGNAKIIYGHNSDEMLRTNGLIALAVADKIYMQTRKYKPETEEGSALLAHELTHIAQHKNKEEYKNSSKSELEQEAEINELNEKYNPDPLIAKKIGKKEYKFTKSIWKRIINEAVKGVEQYIEAEECRLSEEKYLELLLKYRKFMSEDILEWEI